MQSNNKQCVKNLGGLKKGSERRETGVKVVKRSRGSEREREEVEAGRKDKRSENNAEKRRWLRG